MSVKESHKNSAGGWNETHFIAYIVHVLVTLHYNFMALQQ